MKLFIADDELDVREGLRYLLDWSSLGFYICGEGKNGQDTLEQILKLQPDIVLLDIRMPRFSGLEVVRQSREEGFLGKFIILSGYSDFSYAQEAIRYGVTRYLTKPIDELELEKAIMEAKDTLSEEQSQLKKLVQYRDKARESILVDILYNTANYQLLNYHDLILESNVFQVVTYTNYNQESFQAAWDFAGILRLANRNNNSLDYINLENQNIILLKGETAINRFKELLSHYIEHPQKGSPLDSLFLAYGRPVYSADQIHLSYEDTRLLMNRRFFCRFNQHVLGYKDIPQGFPSTDQTILVENTCSQRISDCIQSGNRRMLHEVLDELKENLYYTNAEISILKHYLTDIIIQVKSILTHTYGNMDIPFPNNNVIITMIEEKFYLYEIMQFFTIQFEMYMNALGTPSRESVMDGILHYIRHNYQESLKLGTIAELFGYNSSYLGKVFNKAVGKSFNSYVDEVRIENSKRLLSGYQYKVYEIAQLVGYNNVDYFHKKFKRYVGMSPVEFRKTYSEKPD